jgi:hypothetical protein
MRGPFFSRSTQTSGQTEGKRSTLFVTCAAGRNLEGWSPCSNSLVLLGTRGKSLARIRHGFGTDSVDPRCRREDRDLTPGYAWRVMGC